MKKLVVAFVVSAMWSAVAIADPLADANGLFEKKQYAQALKAYTTLANAGNVEAQQHLGEMYWYGEAGVVDDTLAESWFRKAAAKGNKTAIEALDVMAKRVARKDDINYWVSKYDGADLKSGQYRCPAPRLPAVSKENTEIKAVGDRIETWQNCYNAFVTNLNKMTPLFNQIPKDIVVLMKQEEIDGAKKHLGMVETSLTEQAKIDSKLVIADIDAWRSATNAWVTEHNSIVRTGPTEERQKEIDARKRNYAAPTK